MEASLSTPPTVEVRNPRTGDLLYSFQEITESDVEKMFDTAKKRLKLLVPCLFGNA